MGNKRVFLQELRRRRGTQIVVAEDIGISAVYLRMIESGAFTPGRDLMFKLSNYFGETPEKLFPDYFAKDSTTV